MLRSSWKLTAASASFLTMLQAMDRPFSLNRHERQASVMKLVTQRRASETLGIALDRKIASATQ
ncbi:hypothetical protein SPHINGOT1_480001 [Sphingomonas sp. T1]|nr:hypothetical protein SPHINGOT1_480001 [Sphingomonas sp. T1]